jgi:competence protein ComEC
MSAKKRMTKKQRKRLAGLVLSLVVICAAGLMTLGGLDISPLTEAFPALKELFPQEASTPVVSLPAQGHLRVHFLDVGQGDCVLIQGPESTVMLDGGESEYGPGILEYLRSQGVEEIDYYINSHPHSDHYGGILEVLESIPAETFCIGSIPEDIYPTTRGYEKLVDYLASSGTQVRTLLPGDTLDLGGGGILTVLGPVEEYSDLNNISLVSRLDFGETAFLFCGDAEKEPEGDLLESGAYLQADVWMVPHHGSNTGADPDFLEAVSPEYAVISVGRDNDYGHPGEEMLDLLSQRGITLLRTDLQGTAVFDSDGENLSVSTQK